MGLSKESGGILDTIYRVFMRIHMNSITKIEYPIVFQIPVLRLQKLQNFICWMGWQDALKSRLIPGSEEVLLLRGRTQ